jgi:natural product biosynthesis luciferase-like monooxygenase protein
MLAPQMSLFFFAADSSEQREGKYRMLLESARFADAHGFTAVWTPERHFQRFGGLYGNPSVTSAALAVTTSQISVRAGSVVIPLQNPLRVAEEWSMIDNLSNGRVAIACASGWHANDFVLSPETYGNRHDDMFSKIATIQKLWRGEEVSLPNGMGVATQVNIFPKPIQQELPIWLSAQSDETFLNAGRLGFNVLTANFSMNNSLNTFLRKAKLYRDAIQTHHSRRGHITLMAHAYVGENEEEVRTIARPAMAEYIRVNIDMQKDHATATKDEQGSLRKTSWVNPGVSTLGAQEIQEVVEFQVQNNLRGPLSFIGTFEQCARQAELMLKNGVDEIACLIDFGVGFRDVMASLGRLCRLISHSAAESRAASA